MYAKCVEELLIYQIAVQLSVEIYELTDIPFSWKIPEINQIKRSSSSISSNITEGFSQRFHPKKFVHFLYIAMGSSDETQNHLEKLYKKGIIDEEKAKYYISQYKNLSVKLVNFITYLRTKHNLD